MKPLLHRVLSCALAAALVASSAVVPRAASAVPLSEIAEKAKKKQEEQKPGAQDHSDSKKKEEAPPPAPPPPPPEPRDDGGYLIVQPLPVLPWPVAPHYRIPVEDPVPYEDGDYPDDADGTPDARVRIGALLGGGGLAAGELDRYGSGGFLLGWGEPGWSLDGRVWYSRAQASAELDESFTSFRGWAGDLAWRVGLAPRATRLRPSAVVVTRLGRYRWDFRNPVTVPELGNRRFTEDKIGFWSLLGGIGVDLAGGAGWTLGATIAAGYQGFDSTTDAGFENDLFDGGAVIEISGNLVFSPPR
jgi:hypothetical protein